MISTHLMRVADALVSIAWKKPDVVRVLPLSVAPRSNGSQGVTRGGRYARAETARKQREAACRGFGRSRLRKAVTIRLVRIAPRALDDDNLASAMKSVRDGVADALGMDDRDSRVLWLCDQESGRPSVRVEVYREVRP